MTDTDPIPSAGDSLDALRRLVATALYNTEYYTSDEGYWYPRDVFYADLAVSEIAQRLAGRDLAVDDLALIREAIAAPDAPFVAVEKLLAGLNEQAAPLIADLLADPAPDRRAMAVRLAPGALDPARWLPALDDPHPGVRRTAVVMLIAAHWQPDDNPRKPRDYKAHVRRALGDPDPEVRLAAASSTARYVDREGNAVLASLIEQEPDAAQRRSLLGCLIQAADWPDGLHDPVVRAALLRGLNHDDDGIRRIAIDKLSRRVLHAAAEEELTAICIAAFERLLIERESDLIQRLTDFGGYPRISDYVVDQLTALLPDELPRHFGLPFFLRQFGAAGVPLLRRLASQPGYISVQAQMSLDAIAAVSGE